MKILSICNNIFPHTVTPVPSFKSRTDNTTRDVFIKSSSVKNEADTDEDNTFSSFLKWSNDTNFLKKLSQNGTEHLKFIGSGFEGSTYMIDDTDNWVLKQYERGLYTRIQTNEPVIKEIEDKIPKLNAGQSIAYVLIPVNSELSLIYYVLKKQPGSSFGIDYFESDNYAEYNIKNHLNTLNMLASAPDSTYDKLVRDIKYISQNKLEFDYNNPRNFMYDKDTNSINFVDINDELKEDTDQYESVLFALTDGNFGLNFADSEVPDSETKSTEKQLSSEIFLKYTNAMKKYGFKFADNEVTDRLFGRNRFSEDILPGKTLEARKNALKNQGLM